MMAFDPTLSCPIMKGITCAQEDCVFWDATLLRCSLIGAGASQDYNELTGTQTPSDGEMTLDLGRRYKDITIYVDWDARVKFTNNTNPPIDLTVANGRVGVAVLFEDINAQYVYLTGLDAGDLPFNYIVTGNG
jgi:hypothetical protein